MPECALRFSALGLNDSTDVAKSPTAGTVSSSSSTASASAAHRKQSLQQMKQKSTAIALASAAAVSVDSATVCHERRYRVVVMGSARVGKTAIVNQFLYDTFVDTYTATVEEMHRGEYEIGGSTLTLDIVDTAGAYPFPAMRALNIANADAFILIFSVDSQKSFEQVRLIREEIVESRFKDRQVATSSNLPKVTKI